MHSIVLHVSPADYGGVLFSYYSVKCVYARLRKNDGGTTIPRQPQQYSKHVVILDTQLAVCPLPTTSPKIKCLERLIESFEKIDFNQICTTSKVSNQHVTCTSNSK